MIVVSTITDLKREISKLKGTVSNFGAVSPYLHKGHQECIRKAVGICDHAIFQYCDTHHYDRFVEKRRNIISYGKDLGKGKLSEKSIEILDRLGVCLAWEIDYNEILRSTGKSSREFFSYAQSILINEGYDRFLSLTGKRRLLKNVFLSVVYNQLSPRITKKVQGIKDGHVRFIQKHFYSTYCGIEMVYVDTVLHRAGHVMDARSYGQYKPEAVPFFRKITQAFFSDDFDIDEFLKENPEIDAKKYDIIRSPFTEDKVVIEASFVAVGDIMHINKVI